MTPRCTALGIALFAAAGACQVPSPENGREQTTRQRGASVPAPRYDRTDPELIRRGRLDPSWRVWAERDRAFRHGAPLGWTPRPEPGETGAANADDGIGADGFADIEPAAVEALPALPIRAEGAGPAILHAQILLDRSGFSPGEADGHWDHNTEKAVYWFQEANGLEPTGRIDDRTYDRIRQAAGPDPVLRRYEVTGTDVEGPFIDLPPDLYERASLDQLAYESSEELLGERFHTSPEVLRELNAGVDLAALRPGAELWVPNVEVVRQGESAPARVSRIVVSKDGSYLHALGADGDILFHFPSTLGAEYDPGRFQQVRITAVVFDPDFLYQPSIHGGPKDAEQAVLPAGPNSPVGVVWIELDEPGYGIHGTYAPSTVGYATSAGCVRLTNWDAMRLANRTRPGVVVEFR